MIKCKTNTEVDDYVEELKYWNEVFEDENESWFDKKEYEILYPSHKEDMNSKVTITYINKDK